MMERFGEEEIEAVGAVIRSGQLSSFYRNFLGGGQVQAFEDSFRRYHGVTDAIAVSSGTAALHTALLACGVGEQDEVITTPYTFVATASTITMTGARPVFVDIDPNTYNMDPELIEGLITPKTKAILPVHLLGHPANMPKIMEIAAEHKLFVIEDCAQALGAMILDKLVGTWGDLSCFSLQETKTITSAGEGGMILSNNLDLITRCQAIRNHGEYYKNPHEMLLGYNYRMTEMAAAFGLVQFGKLREFLRAQMANAEYLVQYIRDYSNGEIYPPYVSPNVSHVFFIIGCQMKRPEHRMDLLEGLKGWAKGRPGASIGVGYPRLIYEIPYFAGFARPCPVAEYVRDHALWLDIHRFREPIEEMDQFLADVKVITEGFGR